MNENAPIIDVTPIEHSSKRIRAARAADSERAWRGGASPAPGASAAGAARSPFSVVGGLAQVVAGAALIAIGVPMLVLPGPGLLSIGAGALLVARGVNSIRFRRP